MGSSQIQFLKEGKVAGTDEYIEGNASITGNGEAITVSFPNATRNIHDYALQRILKSHLQEKQLL